MESISTPSPQDLSRAIKPKLIRRHGACEPCRISKTKCDGGQPCCSCRSEKRKAKTCEYNQKAREIAAARSRHEAELNPTPLKQDGFECDSMSLSNAPEASPDAQGDQLVSTGTNTAKTEDRPLMFRRIALCRVVDEFIRVKPLKGHALNLASNALRAGVNICCSGNPENASRVVPLLQPDFEEVRFEEQENLDDEYLPSYLLPLHSQLRYIRDRADSGQLRKAWIACGTVIREIQAYEAEMLYTARLNLPTDKDIAACAELLHLDSCLSFFLGCPSSLQSAPLLKEAALQRNQEAPIEWPSARLELYQTMRNIGIIDVASESGMMQFARLAKRIVKDSNPSHPLYQIAHCPQGEENAVTYELKLFANLVLIVVFCRLASICSYYSAEGNAVPSSHDNIIQVMELHIPRSRSSCCKSVIKHAQFVLEAFHRLRELEPEATSASWLRIYGALVALELAAAFKLKEKHVDPGVELKMNIFYDDIQALQALNPDKSIFSDSLEVYRRFTQIPTSTSTHEAIQEKICDENPLHPIATALNDNNSEGSKRQKRIPRSETAKKRNFDQMVGEQERASSCERRVRPTTAKSTPRNSISLDFVHPPQVLSEQHHQQMLLYPHPPLLTNWDTSLAVESLNINGTVSFSEVDQAIYQPTQYAFNPAANDAFHPPLAWSENSRIHPPMVYDAGRWPATTWSEHVQMLYSVPQDQSIPVSAPVVGHMHLPAHDQNDANYKTYADHLASMPYGSITRASQPPGGGGEGGTFFENWTPRHFERSKTVKEPAIEQRPVSERSDRRHSLQSNRVQPQWPALGDNRHPMSTIATATNACSFPAEFDVKHYTTQTQHNYGLLGDSGLLAGNKPYAYANFDALAEQQHHGCSYDTQFEHVLRPVQWPRVSTYS